MHTRTAEGLGFDLAVNYPAGWHVASRVVPNLYSPHELCAISNRPLRPVPVTSDQNTPNLIWIYYEVLGEVLGNPVIRDPERPPIPDYSRYSYPLRYNESELFPVQLAYDWASNILWRRVGHNLAPTARRREPAALTVMVWEGTSASADDLRSVEEVVASVSIS